MVHEHIFRRHTGGCGVVLHHIDFVIFLPAMVAAHEQLGRGAQFIEPQPHVQPVPQHKRRLAGIPDAAAQHQDTVRALQRRRFLRRQDMLPDTSFYMTVDRQNHNADQQRQRRQHTEDSQPDILHKDLPVCTKRAALPPF